MYTINEETKEITISEVWTVGAVQAVLAMMNEDDIPEDIAFSEEELWEILKRVTKSNEFIWNGGMITDIMVEQEILDYIEERSDVL